MEDLIKNAVKTKNITNKNKMPEYMLKAAANKGNINIDNGPKMGAIDVTAEGKFWPKFLAKFGLKWVFSVWKRPEF